MFERNDVSKFTLLVCLLSVTSFVYAADNIEGTHDETSTAWGKYSYAKNKGVAIGQNATIAEQQIKPNQGSKDVKNNVISGVAIGNNATVERQYGIAIGDSAKVTQDSNATDGLWGANEGIAIGQSAKSSGQSSQALGANATALNSYTLAAGAWSKASGLASTALGWQAESSNIRSVALGALAKATEINAMALGNNTRATGKYSTAIGSLAEATNEMSTAIGREANASAVKSTAIGSKASASVESAIALGSDSVANIEKGQAGYLAQQDEINSKDKAWVSTYGAVSVGNNNGTRQITNLTAGTQDTDAVNVAQLKRALGSSNEGLDSKINHVRNELNNKINDNRKEYKAGIAGATAIASIPYMPDKKFSYGVAAGFYKGAYALGGGVQYKYTHNNNRASAIRLNFSLDSNKNTSVGIGYSGGFD